MEMTDSEWFAIAELLRPQGRRGELLAEPQTDLPVFTQGQSLWLAEKDGAGFKDAAKWILEGVWQPSGKNAGRIVLKLRGLDSISDAEAVAGRFLFIRTSDLPTLEEGTYLTRDLLGCTLFNRDAAVGTVEDVQFAVTADGRARLAEAADLLAIRLPGDDQADAILVPFVRAWLLKVDIGAKEIHMQLPPGLIETFVPDPTADEVRPGQ